MTNASFGVLDAALKPVIPNNNDIIRIKTTATFNFFINITPPFNSPFPETVGAVPESFLTPRVLKTI